MDDPGLRMDFAQKLADPVFDALLTGESRFEDLPATLDNDAPLIFDRSASFIARVTA